jgi:hypothetical protein
VRWRFFDHELPEDFLEEIAPFFQRPFRQQQITLSLETKRAPLSIRDEVDCVHAIGVLAVDRVGHSKNRSESADQSTLLGRKASEGLMVESWR